MTYLLATEESSDNNLMQIAYVYMIIVNTHFKHLKIKWFLNYYCHSCL